MAYTKTTRTTYHIDDTEVYVYDDGDTVTIHEGQSQYDDSRVILTYQQFYDLCEIANAIVVTDRTRPTE